MIERSATRSKVSLPVLEGTQRHLESLDELPLMASTYRLLGDPTRLKILLSLSHAKELCVSDLADILAMDTSAISHQLRKLKDGGLVGSTREGPIIYYHLVSDVIREALATARSLLIAG
ncbi:MAG: winged helix-turn-helix transcriptional regulator [Fidelibacterota bacterium]|nr:MAG: winged helix-turn-helix transcriptional regulator [Candidatus Neomarinimicrobiota bacterium]